LLALRTVVALPSLLPVVLYIGALLGFGRLYRDSEVMALSACGLSPVQIHRGAIAFSVVAALFVGALSFYVRPWAANRLYEVEAAAMHTAGVESITLGRFYERGSGDEQVLFAERQASDDPSYLEGVFVQQRRGTKVSIFVAARATEFQDGPLGVRYLRLIDGYRYDIEPPDGDSEITQYAELVLRTANAVEEVDPREKAQSSSALAASKDPEDIGEWQWRLAMPVSTVLLLLMAIPLGRIEPRAGRYGRFLLAIVLYMGYRQLLGTTKAWLSDSTLAPFPGLWLAHAACVVCILILMAIDAGWTRQLRQLGTALAERARVA
jgi:lipopolysaccharide export system permease protein